VVGVRKVDHARSMRPTTLFILTVLLVGTNSTAHALSANDVNGTATSPRYAVRSAVIRIDRRVHVVRVYLRMNRSLPFGPEAEDPSSPPYVHARVYVARKPVTVARGVMRMGDFSRHCYNDEQEHDALPKLFRDAKVGSYLPITVYIDGRSGGVTRKALVIGRHGSPRIRLGCGQRGDAARAQPSAGVRSGESTGRGRIRSSA
jgi:hypothetical protein